MADRADIPDDPAHASTRALYQELDDAAHRKAREAHRPAARGRRLAPPATLRRLGLTVAAVVAASSIAAVATRDHHDGGPPVAGEPATREPAARRLLGQATAPDPVDAGYPWGLRVRRGAKTCVLVGRIDPQGRLGLLESGRFQPYAGDVTGPSCRDLDRSHFIVGQRRYGPGLGTQRTVLFGVVDRTITSVELRPRPGARPQPIRIADQDGTFVVPFVGAGALDDAAVRVTGATGVISVPLGPGG